MKSVKIHTVNDVRLFYFDYSERKKIETKAIDPQFDGTDLELEFASKFQLPSSINFAAEFLFLLNKKDFV